MSKVIKFVLLPYRSSDNSINPNWVKLALVDEDFNILSSQELRKDAWAEDASSCREYWKKALLTEMRNSLAPNDGERHYVKYLVDKDVYDTWYKWYYYIDGEDASAYIKAIDKSQHSLNFQSSRGVVVGWKYFKVLQEHNFKVHTSAMLAYARGYLAGMEANSSFHSEGMEALYCLGLDIKGGRKALMQ